MVRSAEAVTKWDAVFVGRAAPGLSPRTKIAEKRTKKPPAKPPGGFDLRREGKAKRKGRYGRRRPNHPRAAEWQRGGEKGKGKKESYQNKQEARKEKKPSRGPLAKPKEPRAKSCYG
jgi:hypothetical protein